MLFEGGAAAVAAQVEAMRRARGGEPPTTSVWEESRARQGAARGRVRFVPGELRALLEDVREAIVRPAAGVAYVPEPSPDEPPGSLRVLQERVRASASTPHGILT